MGNSVGSAQSPRSGPALPDPPGLITVCLSHSVPWPGVSHPENCLMYAAKVPGGSRMPADSRHIISFWNLRVKFKNKQCFDSLFYITANCILRTYFLVEFY